LKYLTRVYFTCSLDSSKRTFSGSSLDVDIGNNKSNNPHTPSIQKVLFEKCHRTTRSMSHFKGTKSLLGSSLDQGLNQPVIQSQFLNNQSKRVCKSEESAINSTALSLPRNLCSVSSDETLNEAIFDRTRDSMNRVQSKCNNIETNNVTLIESDIEIMVPMSVSKPRVNSDNNDNPANARQRSSNSISSCEMALSSSIVDGEDSSNGNSSLKNEESCDGVFTSQENLKLNNTDNSKASVLNESFDIENERLVEGSQSEGIDETCEQNSFINKIDDSNHSLEKIQDCDRKNMGLRNKSQESLMLLKEHTIKCDTDARYP
jgi:hypothetical protein